MQREFGAGIVATADFVYTHGSDLATLVNLNQPLPSAPGANDAKGALPYPNFGFIEWRSQNGKSDYKGIDVGVEKRFSQGYAFGVAYTLGDSKDNSSEQLTTQGSNAFPQNSRDFTNWYGPSDYDVRHRLTTNFVVNLPLGHNAFARDWVASGVYASRSGRPFTVNQSNNNVGQSMTGLPDLTGDPHGPETVDQWFNTAAFHAGDVGRVRQRAAQPSARPGLPELRPDDPAHHQVQRPLRRDAAVGRVQPVQHDQLRSAERATSRSGDVGTITSLVGRRAHHAARRCGSPSNRPD